MVVKSSRVEVLDTSLRDGSQGVGVSFSLRDKLRLAELLDSLGFDYIEGGWPGSNPKDEEFFREAKKLSLSTSRLAAFGATRKKGVRASEDKSLQAIVDSEATVGVLFGKSWLVHVEKVLGATAEENVNIVYDSVTYLKSHGLKVIFDAEHFYQGYYDNPEYALSVLRAAEEAGAGVVVLADTNGGMLPHQVFEATRTVVSKLRVRVGLHMHNDSGCAVANTLMGVVAGARHIQGTINGIGERTGNADLIQIIPAVRLKLGLDALAESSLTRLREVSRCVYEMLGAQPHPYQPYVGEYAFAHKAGVHADAVLKAPEAYEHIDPSLVGNSRRIVVSELSGSSNLVSYARELLGLDLSKSDERLRRALAEIKLREKEGYAYDSAPMSALLIIMKHLGLWSQRVDIDYWKVITETGSSIAVVKTNSHVEVSEGVGPVAAVDQALRRSLEKVYPELAAVRLTDYRVVIPGEAKDTKSVVRVTVEFTDGEKKWRTMGVSANVVDASVKALVDGFDYYLQGIGKRSQQAGWPTTQTQSINNV
ncbi:MAG: citramalate synthase [Thermoprotei archaeon]